MCVVDTSIEYEMKLRNQAMKEESQEEKDRLIRIADKVRARRESDKMWTEYNNSRHR